MLLVYPIISPCGSHTTDCTTLLSRHQLLEHQHCIYIGVYLFYFIQVVYKVCCILSHLHVRVVECNNFLSCCKKGWMWSLCLLKKISRTKMATHDFKTSAAKAFREHYDKLVKSIQEPDLPVLGAQFFSRQIISRETMEMVGNVSTSRALRVSKLMLAVMAHLDVHPGKFESALDVFREEPVYSDFASLIALSIGK